VFLSFLLLRDFRNYRYLQLPLNEGVNLFYGKNAQGKTNLLEACYYLSTLSSPRAEKEADLARWGTQSFSVAGRIEKDTKTSELKIETSVSPNVRKRVLLNEVALRRKEIMGAFPCVYFSPDDLYMVKRSASMRRRFIDVLLTRTDETYSREISRYSDAVTRRNHALKRASYSSSWSTVLEQLDKLVIETGSTILFKRMLLVENLSQRVKDTYGFISGKKCNVLYRSSVGQLPSTIEGIVEMYSNALSKVRRLERERGVTLIGPHRDDLEISFDDKTFRYFGSQGEQRSIALALRMAEAKTLEERFNNTPALLLDDVLSELDESRRDKVLSLCKYGHQIFITSTDPVPGLRESVSLFRVQDHTVKPQSV
jgi:DNA replication and repair protein RecF